jgi:hypothetical protein
MSDLDWAWLAGLLDGEATFRFGSGLPRIQLQMTDEDLIQRVANFFNVNYHPTKKAQPHHKQAWQLTICRTEVVIEIYFGIYKYMCKRRQARLDEFVEAWKFKGYKVPHAI